MLTYKFYVLKIKDNHETYKKQEKIIIYLYIVISNIIANLILIFISIRLLNIKIGIEKI